MVPAVPQKFIVQLKGLPFSATPMEIVSFLAVDPHSVKEVELTKSNTGKPSGDCFVVVADAMTQEECVKMHKEIFGDTGRYAEVYKATEEFYLKRLKITHQFDNAWDGTVRLRGLPFKSTEQDIIDFFKPMKIDLHIINLAKNAKGFTNGEAYLEFAKFSEANRALSYNKHTMGDRYIEVFKSSNNELRRAKILQLKQNYHTAWAGSNPSAEPAPKKVKSETKEPKQSRYQHIITLTDVDDSLTAANFQEYFESFAKVRAVNFRENGSVDVAFHSHEDAELAMGARNKLLGLKIPQLTLVSSKF